MEELHFEIEAGLLITNEVLAPISRISVPKINPGNMIFSINIWRQDFAALNISSMMRRISEGEEVGVLRFRRNYPPISDEVSVDISADEWDIIGVEKLITPSYSGVAAESGVCFNAASGKKLIIISGSFPCSLAVSGVQFGSVHFDPEYPLDSYIRRRVA